MNGSILVVYTVAFLQKIFTYLSKGEGVIYGKKIFN